MSETAPLASRLSDTAYRRAGNRIPGSAASRRDLESVLDRLLPPDEAIDAMFGIDEETIRPQAFSNLRPGDKLAILRHQQDKQLHRHPFDLHAPVAAQEFKAFDIQLELAELKDAYAHRSAPRAGKYSSGEQRVGINLPIVNNLSDHKIITSSSPRRH